MIYMNLCIVVVTIIVFIVMTTRAKAKEDREFALKQRKKTANRFTIYYNNFATRKSFRRIVEMYSSLSCYDYDTTKFQSVKLFERNLAITLAIPIVAIFVMQDVAACLLMILLSIVYYQTCVEKEMDTIYIKLMEDCSLALGSIRERYMETDDIPKAILTCEKSKLLEVPLKNIHRILVEVDGDERLHDFQQSYPVRIIRTLANTCYIVNEHGAVRREDGMDSFSEDLQTLRVECDSEIRRLVKQKLAFKSLQSLSLLGLLIMPLSEFYLLSQIPGTAVLLKGFYGEFMHYLVIGITMIAYYYISTVNRPSVVNQYDKVQVIDSLSYVKWFNNFVKNLYPKRAKDKAKLNLLIRDALSSKDMRYIYSAKVVYAIMGGIIGVVLLTYGTITVRNNFKTNYNSLSFIPQNMSESQMQQVMRWDDQFIQMTEDAYNALEDSDIMVQAKGHISGLSDSQASDQCERIRKKYEGYHGARFHWWFVLVVYGAGVVGWFVPEISLMTRKKLVSYEATDDIMQLQTMMIVLSETKMDVYRALIWLEKQSTVHKAPIRKCHYSYIADPEKALDELEHSSPSNDFKRLIRKLKSAVYTLSLHDAFSDMAMDKQQSLTIREMLRNEELEERKNSAKLIAVAPAAVALLGTMMGPVIVLGVSEMMKTMESLNGFI